MKSKMILSWILIFLIAKIVYGVPVNLDLTRTIEVMGVEIVAHPWGDEFSHGYETSDGYTIIENRENDIWSYAELNDNGILVPSSLIPGIDNPEELKIPKHLRPNSIQLISDEEEIRGNIIESLKDMNRQNEGGYNVLAIFIDFPDQLHAFGIDEFQQLLFSFDPERPRSASDYYNEVSYGKFQMIGTTSGWFTARNNRAYYGRNTETGGIDTVRVTELVAEAIRAADRAVDFSKFDNDGDGYVDSLNVFHSGMGEESSGNPDDIWSHMFVVSEETDDGVLVRNYTIQSELAGNHDITSIGVFCHEFGHALGLPDLYDGDSSSSGIGNYGLMSGGSWNSAFGKSGDSPSHLCAWSKMKLQWLLPEVIDHKGTHNILPIEIYPDCYMVNGILPSTEYFLISNRQMIGFDKSLGLEDGGILIWHIDENSSGNNDEFFKLVDLEQAQDAQTFDNRDAYYGVFEDFYREGKEFTQTSVPDSRSNWSMPSGVSIGNFRKTGHKSGYSFFTGINHHKYTSDSWQLNLNKHSENYLVTGSDGTLYVNSKDKNIYAVSPDGDLQWKFFKGMESFNAFATGNDGMVYAGTAEGELYALTTDGAEIWNVCFDDTVGFVKSGINGLIYATSGKNLHAIQADGSIEWSSSLFFEPESMVIDKDGSIYMTPGEAFVFAYTPDGFEKWFQAYDGTSIKLAENPGTDGSIYFYSDAGYIYAIDPDGLVKWEYEIVCKFDSHIMINKRGMIFFVRDYQEVSAINPSGELEWQFSIQTNDLVPILSFSDEGFIYIVARNKRVYALNSMGKGRWIQELPNMPFSNPSAGPERSVYIPIWDGNRTIIHSIKERNGIEFELYLDHESEIFSNGDNFITKMDIFSYSQRITADINLAMLDHQSGEIYFGMKWDTEFKPAIPGAIIPPDSSYFSLILVDSSIPSSTPPIEFPGKYTLAIAAFDPLSKELVSNMASLEFQIE